MTEPTEHVRALFDGANTAHVATVLPDGSPHSVPVWVGWEGDRIAFLTSPGSRKARNIAVDPRVALSVTDAANPSSMATVRGRAERVDGDAAWAIIDRLAAKYIGGPYPLREDRVIFLVAPEHAWGMAFG
jgi:PPOX class probable F420-dependent enzyme